MVKFKRFRPISKELEMPTIKILQFDPLQLELPPGDIVGEIEIELPPVHVRILDLGMGGLLPNAHIGADISAISIKMSVETPQGGQILLGHVRDFPADYKKIWELAQAEFDEQGALLERLNRTK